MKENRPTLLNKIGDVCFGIAILIGFLCALGTYFFLWYIVWWAIRLGDTFMLPFGWGIGIILFVASLLQIDSWLNPRPSEPQIPSNLLNRDDKNEQ